MNQVRSFPWVRLVRLFPGTFLVVLGGWFFSWGLADRDWGGLAFGMGWVLFGLAVTLQMFRGPQWIVLGLLGVAMVPFTGILIQAFLGS